MKGLEPSRIAAPDPKSGVSANFTTSASMVRSRGFEPLTYGLEGRCSIQLSYERITIKKRLEFWYQRGDSNPRPPAYETSALNQLSYLGVPKN